MKVVFNLVKYLLKIDKLIISIAWLLTCHPTEVTLKNQTTGLNADSNLYQKTESSLSLLSERKIIVTGKIYSTLSNSETFILYNLSNEIKRSFMVDFHKVIIYTLALNFTLYFPI